MKCCKVNENTVSPGRFDCRNKIRIACYEYHSFRYMIVADPCEVKTNLDINPFLMELRLEIIICELLFVVCGFPQFPTRELKRSLSNSKEVKLFYVGKKLFSISILRCFFKQKGMVGNRQRTFCSTGRTVVIIYTVKSIPRTVETNKKTLCKLIDIFSIYIVFICCMELFTKKCSVYKNCSVHGKLQKKETYSGYTLRTSVSCFI